MSEQAILEDVFFVTLYGGVTLLNAAAAVYLLLRRGNAFAPEVTSPVRLRHWAAAFLLACALSHLMWLLYVRHPSLTAYVTVCGLDILLFIPTIAGSLLAMLQDRHRAVWPVAVALVPAVVLTVLSIIRNDDALFVPLSVYVVSLYALFMLYIFHAVRRYGRWLRDNYADLEHKEIWQSLLILAVFLLFFIVYSSTTTERVYLYLLQIDNILIVGILLWRAETLQQLAESEPAVAEPADDLQKPSAQPVIPANIGPQLKKHCEDRRIYLQHDLNLAQLAQVIGTNRYYLSQYFAQQGLTYNAYINGLRIRHFIRLYQAAVTEQRTVTARQLAYESGFHSYSTFGAAFKQSMGTTVTAWMHSAAE